MKINRFVSCCRPRSTPVPLRTTFRVAAPEPPQLPRERRRAVESGTRAQQLQIHRQLGGRWQKVAENEGPSLIRFHSRCLYEISALLVRYESLGCSVADLRKGAERAFRPLGVGPGVRSPSDAKVL
jgi:hypothetical protein